MGDRWVIGLGWLVYTVVMIAVGWALGVGLDVPCVSHWNW